MINHSLINQPSCQPADFPFEQGAFLPLAWRKSSVLEGALPSTAPRRFNPLKPVELELKLLKRRVLLETVEPKLFFCRSECFARQFEGKSPGYFRVF